MVKKALFPLSADPITNGHLNIIERATKWVDELVIVILENNLKPPLLTLEQRVEITKSCLKQEKFKKVKVMHFSGLLSNFATQIGIFNVIRGIRNTEDLEYEIFLEFGHKKQSNKLDFVYFLAEGEHRTISSSLAKAILKNGGQIHDYVPIQAKRVMEETIVQQYKMIVTGGIASGKSLITQALTELLKKDGIEVHIIDFDLIVKNIYLEMRKGRYENLLAEILENFGKSILDDEGKISQAQLSKKIFQNTNIEECKKRLFLINQYLKPYIISNYRNELTNKKGIIFLEIPLAAENNIMHESNYNILLVNSNFDAQKKRLMETRKMTTKQAELRIGNAGSNQEKIKSIEEKITKQGVGELIIFNNNHVPQSEKIKELKAKVLNLFSIK